MILPDTSVWIDFLGKAQTRASDRLSNHIRRKQRLCICLPVLQEVLQGARSDIAFGRIRKQLETLVWIEVEDSKLVAILAARIYAQLRWRGHTIRSGNDCLIAAIAIEHDLTLLHDDRDFEAIARIDPRLKLA